MKTFSTSIWASVFEANEYRSLVCKAALAMVFLLSLPEPGNGQLVIDVDTTISNSTLTVTPPHGLFVTHTANNPLLTMTIGATSSGVEGLVLGLLTGESGRLRIEGSSSILNSGSGSLGTFGSQTVLRGDAYIGLNNGSTGSAIVTGGGSSWINSGTLHVGKAGTGDLTVGDAALVSSFSGNIGAEAGSIGNVSVTGEAKWSIADSLTIGVGGIGNLTVNSTGSVIVGTGTPLNEGVYISSDGSLVVGAGATINSTNLTNDGATTITGAGASWIVESTLQVGESSGANGTLRIENGATVSSTSQAFIGSVQGVTGEVTVSGTGSRWNSNGNISIGDPIDPSAVGSLIVENNGQVVVGNGSYSGSGVFISTGSEVFLGDSGLMSSDLIVVDGAVAGNGLAEGDMQVNGMLSPGNSAGTLKVKGNVSISNASTVCIEIGGSSPGLNYDVLDGSLTSSIDLGNSRLELSLINGFVPNPGQQFVFLQNFESIEGTFGNGGDGDSHRIYFAGGSFGIVYGTNSVFLNDFQAVPESGCVSLVLMAGLVMANRRRRK